MIEASIRRNTAGHIYAFTLMNHAEESNVCAAVSFLAQNTANCIKSIAEEQVTYGHDPKGGFLQIELPRVKEGHVNPSANVLLDAFAFGLRSVKDKHRNEIDIKDDFHDRND